MSRRRVAIIADVVRGLIYLAMPFVTSLNLVYIGIFCASVMSRFFYPAKSALVPRLVGRDEVVVAIGLNQTSGSLVAILGPAVGGALAAALGPSVTLYGNAVSFFISALLIAAIRVKEDRPQAAPVGGNLAVVWRELVVGLRFIATSRPVLFVSATSAVAMLFIGGLNVLFVPFLKDILGLGIRQLGLTESAQAVGGLIGALAVTAVATRIRPRILIFGSLVGTGAVLTLVAAARGFWVMAGLAAPLGFLVAAMNVPFNAELVRLVPDAMRGRVFGLLTTISGAASPLAMGLSGVVADLLEKNIPVVYIGCGVIMGIFMLITIMNREFREFLYQPNKEIPTQELQGEMV
jgi:predicted MFS family arabinose efflux permease